MLLIFNKIFINLFNNTKWEAAVQVKALLKNKAKF